jgi:hypothetical protein
VLTPNAVATPVPRDDIPVPPLEAARVPVHPNVKDAAFNNAVVGEPPNDNVTFVSSTFVKAAPVGIWDVVAKVPDVGKVTVVMPVMVNVDAKAPEVARFPARVNVFVLLFTPVPPRDGESVPVHPRVKDVACKSAVAGVPPNVRVTFVSSVFVRALGVTPGISDKKAKVPLAS